MSVDWQHILEFFQLFMLHLVKILQHAGFRSVSDCWQYFVPLGVENVNVVVLQWDIWWISEVQDGFIVVTKFEEVVDHSSNPVWLEVIYSPVELCLLLLWLVSWSFLFGFSWLCLHNLEIKILAVRYWCSCDRCWGSELVNSFSILNFTYP